MNQVEEIVEEILIENDIDFDHPVVPFLFEDVEQVLDELKTSTLKSYFVHARADSDKHWNDAYRDRNTKMAWRYGQPQKEHVFSKKEKASMAKGQQRDRGASRALGKIAARNKSGKAPNYKKFAFKPSPRDESDERD